MRLTITGPTLTALEGADLAGQSHCELTAPTPAAE
jgi:hypothetical protein